MVENIAMVAAKVGNGLACEFMWHLWLSWPLVDGLMKNKKKDAAAKVNY